MNPPRRRPSEPDEDDRVLVEESAYQDIPRETDDDDGDLAEIVGPPLVASLTMWCLLIAVMLVVFIGCAEPGVGYTVEQRAEMHVAHVIAGVRPCVGCEPD